ncbi:MAG: PD-(D/E)XK nuclease family protein [Patescibacteria group bacterium]
MLNSNGKRTRNLYKPGSKEPFKLSRSRIENFIRCPRCFYIDRRLGIDQPQGPPFNLNSAVDALLKKEFDVHRSKGEPHPLMKAYGIDAVPFVHKDLNTWRENFVGVQHMHKPTNLLITGAVDDIWINPKDELIVVDYKATSKDTEVNIDAAWQDSYKRQMEIYQWLLRKNKFKVSDTGYFVYCNARKDARAFDGKLEFDIKLIPYTGDDNWIEDILENIKETLDADALPNPNPACEFCAYRESARKVEE